jgi:8-oxo-dGTP diphosphatase
MSAPEWMNQLITRLPNLQPSDLSRHAVPEESTREAAVLVLFGPRDNFGEVVIIERASHLKAHPGQPAFPGGRVEEGDSSLSQTALREAKEETGLEVELIEQFYVYSDPNRDPRQHTLSVVFLATAIGEPQAADDAKHLELFEPWRIPQNLCFDHDRILKDYWRYRHYRIRPQLSNA